VLDHAAVLVVTKGENGCTIVEKGSSTDVPAVTPHSIVDPTGVGDAFRAGFMKGMNAGASYVISAQLGSVAATYALEHLGGQSHSFTWKEFARRYETSFGAIGDLR
jgi:adenosine kinase